MEKLPELSTQQGPFFSTQELTSISQHPLPKHIAIIPDGNRRWANTHNVPYITAYTQGAQTLIKIALAAKELGISTLTMYSFSTENWKRPKEEIDILMRVFDMHLAFYAQALVESRIQLHVIGNIDPLPSFLQKTISEVCALTPSEKELDLVFAINYGGRDELVRAFKKLLNKLHADPSLEISEESISQFLDTAQWPDPDLVIRTSGEQRLSNFLLWQSSYAEVYTESVQWPDFLPQHLLTATQTYQARTRKRGGT